MSTTFLLGLGDSIMAGGPILGGVPNWMELIHTGRAGTRFAIVDAGVGGYTSAQVKALWEASYRGRGYTHLILLVGTNDLASSASAASILANIVAIVDDAVNNYGMLVAVCTVPPRGGSASWDSTKEAQRLSLNTSILAITNATPVNLEVALGGVGSPLALAVGKDSGDHLHPNGAAQPDIALEVEGSGFLPALA